MVLENEEWKFAYEENTQNMKNEKFGLGCFFCFKKINYKEDNLN